MRYDFDTILDQKGTNSLKWEYRKETFDTEDVLPLWIADMDFPSPDAVTKALIQRAKHPIYGYPGLDDAFFESIINWVDKRYNTEIVKEQMKIIPGVVPGLHLAVNTFTKPGDNVVIQTPVYHPFFRVIKESGRHIVENPLIEEDGFYRMDIKDLMEKIDSKTRMIILCNPHNPVGRVWSKQELLDLADVCVKNDILIVSDEVHSDLIYKEGIHVPFYGLPEEISKHSLSFIAPSKTFNLAGLFTSIAISGSERINQEFTHACEQVGLNEVNIFGIEALKVAYTEGEDWLRHVLNYLNGNAQFINKFLKNRIPQVKMRVPEATYLGWIDFRGLELTDKQLNHFIVNDARLGMNSGSKFGVQGEGFQRINFACPRSLLREAMERLELALKKQ